MDESQPVTTPPGLGVMGARLWREVTDEHEFRPDELALFEQACRLLDELAVMSARVAEDGPVASGSRGQPRPHPLVGEVRSHRLALARIFRQLNIPDPEEDEGWSAASARGRRAAESRWSRRGSA